MANLLCYLTKVGIEILTAQVDFLIEMYTPDKNTFTELYVCDVYFAFFCFFFLLLNNLELITETWILDDWVTLEAK